jgi:hypothetical protein
MKSQLRGLCGRFDQFGKKAIRLIVVETARPGIEHLPKVLSEKTAAAQPVERRHFARAVGNLQPLRSFLAHGLRRSHSFFGNSFWQTLYLRDVLTKLPTMTNWQIKDITPAAYAKALRQEKLRAVS